MLRGNKYANLHASLARLVLTPQAQQQAFQLFAVPDQHLMHVQALDMLEPGLQEAFRSVLRSAEDANLHASLAGLTLTPQAQQQAPAF